MRYGKLGILYNKNMYFDYYFKSIELDNKKDNISCKNENLNTKILFFYRIQKFKKKYLL